VNGGDDHRSVTDMFPRRFEAWIQDGRWREAQDYDVVLYEAGKVWKNGISASDEKRPPLLSSFAVRAITGDDPFGKGVAYNVRLLGDTATEGRTLLKLLVESTDMPAATPASPRPERRLFWVDPETYLPVRMEEMRYEGDRWATDAILWFRYDDPVSAALFDPTSVRAERHVPMAVAHTARDYYRMTDAQHARFLEIGAEHQAEQDRIEADPRLSRQQKDRQLVQAGAVFMDRVGRMLNPDQRRLWSDWLPVQAEMLKKLMTPQQRREDVQWRLQQQKLFDDWLSTQDERTKQLLQGHSGL